MKYWGPYYIQSNAQNIHYLVQQYIFRMFDWIHCAISTFHNLKISVKLSKFPRFTLSSKEHIKSSESQNDFSLQNLIIYWR